nr:hypothetical protein 8 [Desulfobulbaceae bacterium]
MRTDIPTFDTSKEGGGAESWRRMQQYFEENREPTLELPEVTEEDHPRIIEFINAADASVSVLAIAEALDLPTLKLMPVLKYLAQQGHFRALVHRFVAHDVYNRWDEAERFQRQHER